MLWLQSFAAELGITLSTADWWLAIGQALLFAGVCLLLGTWVARTVGLLASNAPTGETLGVGLASGLMVLAAWWAAIASGGRSSFTPVAVGFAIAVALALGARARPLPTAERLPAADVGGAGRGATQPWSQYRRLVLPAVAGAVLIAAVALVYGSTMVPSPRDGVQPVEFMDLAYYSILGRDIAVTGIESTLSPSGFSQVAGLPAQAWYHWGELWLASAVRAAFGTAPLAARHFVVLPVVLLAAAALTGTVVRRLARTGSSRAYLFGFFTCLFLAPVPFIPGPFFSSWAVGLIFGITQYGLAAVAILLGLYGFAVLGTRRATWALAAFVGSAVAMVVPSHVVIAVLACVGVGSVWAVRTLLAVTTTRRLPVVSEVWRRSILASVVAVVVTVLWGSVTGHALGSGGLSPGVSPFNSTWRESVAITVVGAGAFFAIAPAWFVARRKAPLEADVYIGTLVLLLAGALAWGARLGDFNMFHVFYGGISVFAAPVAAVAVISVARYLRTTRHPKLAAGFLAVCAIQLGLGVALGVLRLQGFGPNDYRPMPVSLLEAIGQLPPEAKLAYACGPFEEFSFADQRLLSVDAHTGRRVVPMCYQAELFGTLIGAERSVDVPSTSFRWAPQRSLYPESTASPSSAAVAAFLKENGIQYIYADHAHPNSLVADAVVIAASGDAQILRVP